MDKIYESKISLKWGMEAPGIDPGTSRMLSERSTIWATPPGWQVMPLLVGVLVPQKQHTFGGDPV